MDSAFKTGAYPGYTTAQLEQTIADRAGNISPVIIDKMIAEVDRRKAVAAGDRSQMTDGERLRAARAEHPDLPAMLQAIENRKPRK